MCVKHSFIECLFLCLFLWRNMIKEKYLKIKWCNGNKKKYTGLGYEFTQYGDEFSVSIDDMPPYSEVDITSICDCCGVEKIQTLHSYNTITKKQTKNYICRDCYMKDKIITYKDLVEDFKDSDYILLTSENEYINGETYIQYKCPNHGIKKMKAQNFHNGKRCPVCHQDKMRKLYSHTPEEVNEIVTSLGGELLNKEDYINQDIPNLKILCPRCKTNNFTTSLKHFKQHGGQSCENCRNKESVGERRIRQWLEENNISFEQEKRFDDCKDVNPLPFDFYLPSKNIIIEFDGQQHFKENHFFVHEGSRFNNSTTSYVQFHDSLKNKYCIDHNINLIRISYTKLNDLEKILQEKIYA